MLGFIVKGNQSWTQLNIRAFYVVELVEKDNCVCPGGFALSVSVSTTQVKVFMILWRFYYYYFLHISTMQISCQVSTSKRLL